MPVYQASMSWSPPPQRSHSKRASSAQAGVSVSADAVDVCRVEAGRPRFGVDMTADTIPLEAGIEDRAISLTKGCYVGQEVIIRVPHRGHGRVARRLVGLALPEPSHPVPERGATVRAAEREVGAVTSAVKSPALGHPIALGVRAPGFPTARNASAGSTANPRRRSPRCRSS